MRAPLALLGRDAHPQARSYLLGNPMGVAALAALAWTSRPIAIVTSGLAMILLGLTLVARWPETHRARQGPGAISRQVIAVASAPRSAARWWCRVSSNPRRGR